MAFTPPEKLPENHEELEEALVRVYKEGKEVGKRELREAIRTFLTQKFHGSKGNERRADPENPKTAAVLTLMELLYEKFRDGSL